MLTTQHFDLSRYQQVAVACLLIASKNEELEYNVPKTRYFVKSSGLDMVRFRRLELEIL